MASQIDPPTSGSPPATGPFGGLARLTGLWFVGLAGTYLLYGWSTGLGMEGDAVFLERVTMVLGPSAVAFALIISPSLFAAGVVQLGPLERGPGRVLRRRGVLFLVFAGIAYLLSTIGATIATSVMSPVVRDPVEALSVSPSPTGGLSRHLIPVSLAAFVPISGTAGTLVGHVTSPWQPALRNATRWVAGITLMASFLLPFLATANAIALQGTSPIWIIVNPLVLPLVLTSALAVRERDALGLRLGAWWRRTGPNSLDPEALDRIITAVTGDPGSRIDPRSLTGPEREMAAIAAAIRSIAGSRPTLSESRVREIVTAIIEASPPNTSQAATPRRSWFGPSELGGFCTSWTCLAVGLVIVSPLGGVPISVATAAVVGFLGSAGILLISRRFPGLASAVAS